MIKLEQILAAQGALRPPPSVQAPPIPRAVWDKAVGTRIAERTQPFRLERGCLEVKVASSAWANELSLLAGDIQAQLTAAGWEIASLRFVVGPVQAPPRRAVERRRTASPRAEVPSALRARMAEVEDPELRAALEAAAAKTLDLSR